MEEDKSKSPEVKKKSQLKTLKENYDELKVKYDLPSFNELNVLFDIEDIDSSETDLLLRKIRRSQIERVSGYLRFIETILNPSNAPIFFFKLIKELNDQDKESLAKIYDSLNILEIENLKFDFNYSEEKESEFIKKIFSLVQQIKPDLLKVIDKLSNSNNKKSLNKNSNYFG
jgi:hypothetical protein